MCTPVSAGTAKQRKTKRGKHKTEKTKRLKQMQTQNADVQIQDGRTNGF